MIDFLLEFNNPITFGVEVIAALTGLFFYKKYRYSNSKYFIWFLLSLAICDTLGNYVFLIHNDGLLSFLQDTVFIRNYWWYTSFWKIGAILFFGFYYHKTLKRARFKMIIKISTFSFLIFSFVYIGLNFNSFFIKFFPMISVFGAIIVFLSSVFYFIETLLSDNILSFYRKLNFYISAAIFIWWLIITPIVFYDIYKTNNDSNYNLVRTLIYLFANLSMYLTFTFALIFCKPESEIDKA